MTALELPGGLRMQTLTHGRAAVLVVSGVLDGSSYRALRDAVIKAALELPVAVVVDVDGLVVPSLSAWTVFTSARWHVSVWPDVPIVLACSRAAHRDAIAANGVTRYVPVYPSRAAAAAAIADTIGETRRRARIDLPRVPESAALARVLVRQWVAGWLQDPMIPVACTVATVLVDNVLDHTVSAPSLILESRHGTLTVATEGRQPRAGHPARGIRRLRRADVRPGDRGGAVPGLGLRTHPHGQNGVGRHRPGERAVNARLSTRGRDPLNSTLLLMEAVG